VEDSDHDSCHLINRAVPSKTRFVAQILPNDFIQWTENRL